MVKKEWQALPDLPEEVCASAATVLDDVLYNLGGSYSKHSVSWLDLLGGKGEWKTME